MLLLFSHILVAITAPPIGYQIIMLAVVFVFVGCIFNLDGHVTNYLKVLAALATCPIHLCVLFWALHLPALITAMRADEPVCVVMVNPILWHSYFMLKPSAESTPLTIEMVVFFSPALSMALIKSFASV